MPEFAKRLAAGKEIERGKLRVEEEEEAEEGRKGKKEGDFTHNNTRN